MFYKQSKFKKGWDMVIEMLIKMPLIALYVLSREDSTIQIQQVNYQNY